MITDFIGSGVNLYFFFPAYCNLLFFLCLQFLENGLPHYSQIKSKVNFIEFAEAISERFQVFSPNERMPHMR